MNAAELHQDAIILDGLVISKWSRPVFEDMRRGGLTAANCTCSVWEGIRGTLDNVAEWKRLFRENADLILQVFDTSDIARAKKESKTGIILGWQNTSGIEASCPKWMASPKLATTIKTKLFKIYLLIIFS